MKTNEHKESRTYGEQRRERAPLTPEQVAEGCAAFIMAGLGNIANGQRPPADWASYVADECDRLRSGAWRLYLEVPRPEPDQHTDEERDHDEWIASLDEDQPHTSQPAGRTEPERARNDAGRPSGSGESATISTLNSCVEIDAEERERIRCSSLDGWVRIGRYDDVRRRAIWSRVTEPENASSRTDATLVEIRAGREGHDTYVRFDRSNPQFHDVLDVVCSGEWFAELREHAEQRKKATATPDGCPAYDLEIEDMERGGDIDSDGARRTRALVARVRAETIEECAQICNEVWKEYALMGQPTHALTACRERIRQRIASARKEKP